MDENLSLSQWVKDTGLSKTQVWKRCQEMGIPTRDGLSADAIKILEKEFNVASSPQEPPPQSAIAPQVEVGNHQITIAPQLPQSFSLEGLRSGEVQTFENPLAIAQQFVGAAAQITQAMQADIESRRRQLEDAKTAKEVISAQAEKLALEARLYQLQADQLDRDTSEETKKIQERLAELQRLGKPSEPPPQSAQS